MTSHKLTPTKQHNLRFDLLLLLGYLDLYPLVYRMDVNGPRPVSIHSDAFKEYKAKHEQHQRS